MSQFTGGGEGHQHLGAVGEDTLEDAGEGVQQGGGLSGGDAVVLGHLLGDGIAMTMATVLLAVAMSMVPTSRPMPS